MDRDRLVAALSADLPAELADDLVNGFLTIRRDAATRTYERAAPGKFVETLVQVLQHKATGSYDARPNIEGFLHREVENHATLDDGLRICAARVGRAIYTLRNKRNIAHKGAIDPNSYDLEFVHGAARWVVAELLRQARNTTMEEAGMLVDMVHAPLSRVVEEIDGRRLVHGKMLTREEILVLLQHHYPNRAPLASITEDLDRRSRGSVRARISELYRDKLIQGDARNGYRLTTAGYDEAAKIAVARFTGT